MKDNKLYLDHIMTSIARIEEYVSGGRESFMSSILIQDAVIRNLQTMAESTQRLSGYLKDSHPEIDWRRMAAFRNILVHAYLGINLATVWEVIEINLPDLKRYIEQISQELER